MKKRAILEKMGWVATQLQSVRMWERSLYKQRPQEVIGVGKEMVTVADSPIGSSPS